MELFALRFLPKAGFTTLIDSYTLFGTFCWSYRLIFGEKRLLELLNRFIEDPPFLISSPVLYSNREYYFPTPYLPAKFEEQRETECSFQKDTEGSHLSRDRKFLKKLYFIPWRVLKKVLDGEVNTVQDLKHALLSLRENGDPSFPGIYPQLIIRNRINRLTNTVFFGGLINITVFYYPVFLIFILLRDNSLDPEFFQYVFNRFPLGGRKSSGIGFSEVKIETSFLDIRSYLSPTSDYIYLLSPSFLDKVYLLEHSYYMPFVYFGRIEKFYYNLLPTIIKERVLYLKSGSVLRVKDRKSVYGSLKVVAKDLSRTTDVKIYQYGYTIPLYFKKFMVEEINATDNSISTPH